MSPHEETIPRFPLSWPTGWIRTPPDRRRRAAFKSYRQTVSITTATQRLEAELDRLGAKNAVLSTNVPLRLDGRPRGDGGEPADSGAAVYFSFRAKATVLACDRWDRVADNIVALAAHIDALRRIERYGVGTLEQALSGYKALPADSAADWRRVLGFPAGSAPTPADVEAAFKRLARERHPDRGGTDEGFAHISRARDHARAELGDGAAER